MTPKRILAVTTSPLPVGGRITDGPGFRMWSLLRELGKEHSVHILSLYESFHRGIPDSRVQKTSEGFEFEAPSHRPRTVQRRIGEIAPDILYLPWQCSLFLGSANRGIPTILDYVGPGLLEEFASRGRISSELVHLFLDSFGYGDFLLTTTTRERYYLIGLLVASGQLSRSAYDRTDPLVEVVRMTPSNDVGGSSPRRARDTGGSLVVLLAGAFLPWYDYSPLGEAIGSLDPTLARRVKVLVLGGNPRMPEMDERVRTALLSNKNASCFTFLGLVPFAERLDHYRAADVALAIGPKSVEDELSARTRVVDYLGAGLPTLSSGRDEYSSEIIGAGAGFPFESATELATWFDRLIREPELLSVARSRIPSLLEGPFNGTIAARPVLRFVDRPRLRPRTAAPKEIIRGAALWLRDSSRSLLRSRH